MQDGCAQVLIGRDGNIVAVLSSWPDAQVYIGEHPSRRLSLVEEPGLLDIIRKYCGQAHIGDAEIPQEKNTQSTG